MSFTMRDIPALVTDAARAPAYILVTGLTGAGKSTFVGHCIGPECNISTSNSLGTGTPKPTAYSTTRKGRRICLIDTPGFGDKEITDAVSFEGLADFLGNLREHGRNLTGILYLHEITKRKLMEPDLEMFKILLRLVGSVNLPALMLTTTGWDLNDSNKEERKKEEEREKELKNKPEYFGNMISLGAGYSRHNNTDTSAWKIVDTMIMGGPVEIFQLQRELLQEGKTLANTAVGRVLIKILEKKWERSRNDEQNQNLISGRLRKLQDAGDYQMIRERRKPEMVALIAALVGNTGALAGGTAATLTFIAAHGGVFLCAIM